MARILWWAPSNDGSSYYRMTLPAAAVQWQGHECKVVLNISKDDLQTADALVVGRPAKPVAHDAIEAFTRFGKPVIADLDDDYWHLDESNSAAHRFWTPALQGGLDEGLSMVDVVTTASERLAAVVASRIGNVPVQYIPNGLHAQWLGLPRDYRKDTFTMGWAGTSNTLAWLPMIVPAVNKILHSIPESRFVAVGIPKEILVAAGFDGDTGRVGSTGYITEHDEYLKALYTFDVMLAPYRSTPFTEAKFPTKALECGFLGIPLIASAIGPYSDWLGSEGKYGFRISQDYQWEKAIRSYAGMPAVRQMVGENARANAAHYIMQSLGLKWASLIEGLLNK